MKPKSEVLEEWNFFKISVSLIWKLTINGLGVLPLMVISVFPNLLPFSGRKKPFFPVFFGVVFSSKHWIYLLFCVLLGNGFCGRGNNSLGELVAGRSMLLKNAYGPVDHAGIKFKPRAFMSYAFH